MQELRVVGAAPAGRPHAAGAGRGVPLIQRQALSWEGCDLLLEAHHARDATTPDEVSLTLPPWDELQQRAASEDDVWRLIDATTAACAARFGAIGDGEAMELLSPADCDDWVSRARRHTGLLLRAGDAAHVPATVASGYRELPVSGLVVLLR